jgi:hypothetical protein
MRSCSDPAHGLNDSFACRLENADVDKASKVGRIGLITQGVLLDMSRINPDCPDADASNQWIAEALLLREEPDDEEDEEDDENEDEENDDDEDDTDDGYSE